MASLVPQIRTLSFNRGNDDEQKRIEELRRNNAEVVAFNNADVNTQRRHLGELQGLASRTQFNSRADIDNAVWAQRQIQAIQQAGQRKEGNVGTFAADLAQNFLAPAQRIVGSVVNTAQAEDRGARLTSLLNQGQINKDQFNFAAQNVLRDNIQRRVQTDAEGNAQLSQSGLIQTRKANPVEFIQQAAQQGADVGLTYSPIGAGYRGLAGQGLRAAAPQAARNIVREGAAYTAANTANDVLQGRGITPESVALNAATSFGGAALGAGTGISPQVARATPDALRTANTAVERAVNPRVRQIDETIQNYQRAFDVETNPTRRRQINEGLAQLNAERRMMTQGGYIGNRQSNVPDDLNMQQSTQGIEAPQTAQQQAARQASQANIPEGQSIPGQQRLDDSYSNGTTNNNFSQAMGDVPPQRQTRFASQTAPNSGNLSPDLARKVRENAASYSRSTNAGSVEDSINFLKNNSEDGAIDDVLRRLGNDNIDRQTVTDAIATASSLDNRGGARNLELAQNIYDQLSEKLTRAGQTVQAASIISRRTPEGMTYNALRELNKAGVNVTPEIRKQISDKAQEVGKLKLGTERREIATAELQQQVNRLIPTEMVDRIVGTWKAGLLTGIRTTTGGALSNALFRGLREVSRPGAVAIDMLVSALGGKRSVALTQRGNWFGTTEGLSKAKKYLTSGVDERSFTADGKYIDREINFGDSTAGKALGTYVNGVFRIMGAADRPFYYSQFRNSLYEAAVVEARNLKLKGKAFDDYVLNGIKNPTQEATQYATNLAEQAVLGNNTLLSDLANKLRGAAEKQENPAVRATAKATLGVLAPFTKVPSAFLSRVIDFTPIGAVKEAVQQMAKKELNQARLVQAISEAGTGTGLIYLGAELANNDLLSGNYPNDPKEQARWKAEGITPNSIKIGDTWYSLNYAGPIGAVFGIGKSIADSLKEGNDTYQSLVAGATQLATGTLEQSFLSGISGALDAVQDPQRYAENFVRSQAGSVVPTLLNDIGNATDPVRRQANTPLEAIQGRLPGARTALLEQSDAFGNPVLQPSENPLDLTVNPLRPSRDRSTPLTQELSRLKESGNFIFPTQDRTIQQNGETVKLSGSERKQFNDSKGQQIQEAWNTMINDPRYLQMSDSDKKEALERASRDIQNVTKKSFLNDINKSALAGTVKLTGRQNAYYNGYDVIGEWLTGDTVKVASDGSPITQSGKKTTSRKTTGTTGRRSTGRRASGRARGANDTTLGKAILAANKAASNVSNRAKSSQPPSTNVNTKPQQRQTQLRRYNVANNQLRTGGRQA